MIGIEAIASYVPDSALDNVEQARSFGEDRDYLEKNIGALRLPVKPADYETSDMACRAVENLLANTELLREQIEALVVVTQNPDGEGLPHTSAVVQAKLGLPNGVACFDVSLGCSGYVYALSILKGFMQEAGLKRGVLVTADPYSKIIDRADRSTSMLFGDGATATLLSENGRWQIGVPLLCTDGTGGDAIRRDAGKLAMKGRDVFNFAFKEIPQQIRQCLDRNDLTEANIDRFCLHQGSKAIVDAIARKFPESREKFLLDLAATGNTVSSSVPMLLAKLLDEPGVRNVLISGFGVGLSWATNIIKRVD